MMKLHSITLSIAWPMHGYHGYWNHYGFDGCIGKMVRTVGVRFFVFEAYCELHR